ncbi:MAG: TraB/VirB10 family protein [Deferribacterales bacterium]
MKLKERFDALDKKHKKTIVKIIIGIVIVIILAMMWQASGIKKDAKVIQEQETVENTDFSADDKENSIRIAIDKKINKSEKMNEDRWTDIVKRVQAIESNSQNAPQSPETQNEALPKGSIENVNNGQERPPLFNDLKDVPKPETKQAYPTSPEQYQQNNIGQAPKKPTETMISKIGFTEISVPEEKKTAETEVKKKKNWIPSNSIFKAMLVTGVYAPTMAAGKQSPYPVILRLTEESFLPSGVSKNLKGCYVGGEAYGTLSDERVHIRLLNLSCISSDNQKIVDVPIDGYVQGEDNIVGLAGRVVTKQGQVMTAAFVASFLQGMGQAFSLANQTTTVSALGGTTTAISGSDIAKYGAGSGFAESFKMLSEYYMDLLKEAKPVIEVLGGRDEVEVVIKKGVEITTEGWEWEDIY